MDLRPAVSFICSHLWVKYYTLISSRITACLLFRIQMCVDAIILFAETRISKQLKMRHGGKSMAQWTIRRFLNSKKIVTRPLSIPREGGAGKGRLKLWGMSWEEREGVWLWILSRILSGTKRCEEMKLTAARETKTSRIRQNINKWRGQWPGFLWGRRYLQTDARWTFPNLYAFVVSLRANLSSEDIYFQGIVLRQKERANSVWMSTTHVRAISVVPLINRGFRLSLANQRWVDQ